MPVTFTYEKDRRRLQGYFPLVLFEKIAKRARKNRRSLNAELIDLVEKALEREEQPGERTEQQ